MHYFIFLGFYVHAVEVVRMPPICPVKYHHSMVFSDIDQTFIIFGGFDGNEQMPIRVSKFNPTTKDCIDQPELSTYLPYGRSNHCAFYDKSSNSLLVVGGNTKFGVTNEFLIFSLDSYSWRSSYDILPEPLVHMSCTSDSEYGYIYGGFNRTGISDRFYRLNLNTYTIDKLLTIGDVPKLRSYASIAYSNRSIFLWGGKIESGFDFNLYKLYLDNLTWIIQEAKNSDILSQRSHHKSLATENYVFIFTGIPYSSTIYQYFITERLWTTKTYDDFDYRFGYSLLKQNSSAYVYGGRNSKIVFNEILKIELSENLDIIKSANNSMILPPRVFGATAVVLDNLIMFGGQTYKNEKLNDLWVYTTKNNTWKQMTAMGPIPSRRSSTCFNSFGYNVYIFGGMSVNGLENSLYSLNVIDNTWHFITPKNSGPSPRSSCISCGISPNIFIYGGTTAEGWTDELWVYNVETFTYKLLSANSIFSPGKNLVRTCEVLSINNTIVIAYPILKNSKVYIFIFNMKLQQWKPPLYVKSSENSSTKLYSVRIKENVIGLNVIQNREKTCLSYAYYLTVYENSTELQPQWASSVYMEDGFSVVLGNTTYKFGGIYKSTNTVGISMPLNWVYKVIDDHFNTCSEGYEYNTDYCSPCSPGYYNENMQAKSCLPCPIGTFNQYIAANSKLACLPCPSGKYSDIVGASSCFECPPNYFCPTGSFKPSTSKSRVTNISTSQPDYILGNHMKYIELRNKTIIFIGILVIVLTTLMLFKNIRKRIILFDIFKSLRSNKITDIMIIDKTKFGGYASSIAFTLGLYFIITIFTTFLIDNYEEIKTIAPVMLQKSEISGEFNIELFFELYGGQCVDSDSVCADGIYLTENVSSFQQRSMKCIKEANGCRMFIQYIGCALSFYSSMHIQVSEPQSYASSLSINITSNSSIPDQTSSISYTIYPDNENDVFRGAEPTVIILKAIGSMFTYEGVSHAGYHIITNRVYIKGSEVEFKRVFTENSISIVFNFELSDIILITDRSRKMTLITYFLRSISSFLGIITVVHCFYMIYIEVYFIIFNSKKNMDFNMDVWDNTQVH